ncbi:MAG: hypothetical protein ACLTCB_07005 [Merdibacter sp.]
MTKAAQELWEIVAKTELNALIEATTVTSMAYTAKASKTSKQRSTPHRPQRSMTMRRPLVTDAITNLSARSLDWKASSWIRRARA